METMGERVLGNPRVDTEDLIRQYLNYIEV